MKYYIIAGEASGDLHASRLMRELQRQDMDAEFRFFGGDMMAAEGGTRVRHYKDMAYMGFIPVLLHLPTILRNMSRCKEDIRLWHPDVCILVDYPGFNLSIAKYLHKHTDIPVFYYIAPKLWAWKEYRIKNMKRDVDELFSILPFEKDFFEGKHGYPIHYVGNPTADEVREFRAAYNESFNDFARRNGLDADKKIIALLAGSRRQEVSQTSGRSVSTVSCTESIVYIQISHGSQFSSELRIILCLFLMETDVLQHQDLAFLKSSSLCLCIFTDDISSQSNRLTDQFSQTVSSRLHGECRLRSVFRTTQVGNQDHLCVIIYEILDRRESSLDSLIVCNFTCLLIERYVKVHTNDDSFAGNI